MGEDHDPETHLIPNVLRAALGYIPHVELFGTDYPTPDGTCLRDYIHVLDLAEAHILALEALDRVNPDDPFRAYNLGAEKAVSVREVIAAAEEVSGRPVPVRESARRPGDPAVLLASSQKIRRELGWQPKFSDLKVILETAFSWHSAHPSGYASP